MRLGGDGAGRQQLVVVHHTDPQRPERVRGQVREQAVVVPAALAEANAVLRHGERGQQQHPYPRREQRVGADPDGGPGRLRHAALATALRLATVVDDPRQLCCPYDRQQHGDAGRGQRSSQLARAGLAAVGGVRGHRRRAGAQLETAPGEQRRNQLSLLGCSGGPAGEHARPQRGLGAGRRAVRSLHTGMIAACG